MAVFSGGLAQDPQPKVYNDSLTGISFNTWNIESTTVTGGMTFGMALPSTAMKTDATEFIGYLVRALSPHLASIRHKSNN